MFVVMKGPLNAQFQFTSQEKMPKSFQSYEDAREFVVAHLKRYFPKHEYDADNDIWYARNPGDAHQTGFHIKNG